MNPSRSISIKIESQKDILHAEGETRKVTITGNPSRGKDILEEESLTCKDLLEMCISGNPQRSKY